MILPKILQDLARSCHFMARSCHDHGKILQDVSQDLAGSWQDLARSCKILGTWKDLQDHARSFHDLAGFM
jgi:hypothetical protein